ncbi:MAG: hypothetical protein A2Y41_08075 [Spirochaetes bacterium GWB1_36_13]|nr:MAG: hypothetical protein A2Y41_08075 [Spirochaetes bacterium GWB1_36_13]
MRKLRYLLLAALLVVGSFSTLFAVEQTLINFDEYEAKLLNDGVFPKDRTTLSKEDQAKLDKGEYTKTTPKTGEAVVLDERLIPVQNIAAPDMYIDRWIVELNSSAKNIKGKLYSMTKKVTTKGLVGGKARTVLGARVHFPDWPFASWARITPPFEFPTYKQDGSGQFANLNNGLVRNTGQIYQIAIEVNGRNYNNALILRLKNEYDLDEEYFMGYLYFEGWRRLIWKNPHYIANVDLREIMRLPLYPKSIPYKKLDSFIIYRHGDQWGGDFVVYIANVSIAFDLAILEEESDIDDEAVWNIISDRSKEKAEKEKKLNAEILDLRRRELSKMHASVHKEDGKAGDTTTTTDTTKPQQ